MSETSLNMNYEPEVIVDTDPLSREDWLSYRKLGIGGSDVAAIMGISPFATIRDLYNDKLGIEPLIEEEESNWVAKEVGHRLEDLVAEIFAKKTGLTVFPVRKMFRHPLYPFMLADVDFFIIFPDGSYGILECKTCNYNARTKWEDGGIPDNYILQVRHYLSVMNMDKAYIACLYGNNENEFVIRPIERDMMEEEEIIAQEEYFWKEYVEKQAEPPYNGKPDLILASIRKYGGYADKELPEIEIGVQHSVDLEKYLTLSEEKSQLEKRKKEIEAMQRELSVPFVEQLGASCKAVLSDGISRYRITYNPTRRTQVGKDAMEKLKIQHPDIFEEYTKTTESRTFRVKKEACLWMYDISGFGYDIRDVVRVLNLTIRRKNARSYDVDCPFCNHKTGKLNINIEKNVFRCNYCDAHGGMLDLYSKLYNVTKTEANQQIREALNLGQYRDDYPRSVKPERDLEPPVLVNSERASDMTIDQTYSQMLSMLTLSRKHQDDLQRRGLTLEQIAAQRYRSVPLFGIKKLAERLEDKGCTLKGVPGFYQGEDGAWRIHFTAKNSGILIPILSIKGLIQGFQIRLDFVTDSRKYIWFSSSNYQMGVSSGSPVHVIGNLDAETMYVTEGALKGTIAHYLSGDTFLCAPGVNQYLSLHPVLESLSRRNLKLVYEAYDMDKKMRVNCDGNHKKCGECLEAGVHDYCPFKAKKREIIQNGCKKLYEGCRSLSLPVQRMIWNMDENGEWCGTIKGIDDFYYATRRSTKKQPNGSI